MKKEPLLRDFFVLNVVPYNVDGKCNENGTFLSFETKCFGKNYYYYTHAK
jgi:hypothetical protein